MGFAGVLNKQYLELRHDTLKYRFERHSSIVRNGLKRIVRLNLNWILKRIVRLKP